MPRLNPAQLRLFERHVERAIETLRAGDRLLRGAVSDVVERCVTALTQELKHVEAGESTAMRFEVASMPLRLIPYIEDPFVQSLGFNLHCHRTGQSHAQAGRDWEGGSQAVAARNLLFLPQVYHKLWTEGVLDKTRLVNIANRNLTPKAYLEVADLVRSRRKEDVDERLLRMPPGSVQPGRRGPEQAIEAAKANGWLDVLKTVEIPAELVVEAGSAIPDAPTELIPLEPPKDVAVDAQEPAHASHAPRAAASGIPPPSAIATAAPAAPAGPATTRNIGSLPRMSGTPSVASNRPAAIPASVGPGAAPTAGPRPYGAAADTAQKTLRAGLSGARIAPEVADALALSPDPNALVERYLTAHRQSGDPDPEIVTKTLFFAHAGPMQKLTSDDKLLLRHFRPVKTQKRGQLFYRLLEVIEELLLEKNHLAALDERGVTEPEAMVAVRKVILDLNRDPNRHLVVPDEWLGEVTRRHLYFGSRTRKEGAAYKWFRKIGPRFFLGAHKTREEVDEKAARRAAKRAGDGEEEE